MLGQSVARRHGGHGAADKRPPYPIRRGDGDPSTGIGHLDLRVLESPDLTCLHVDLKGLLFKRGTMCAFASLSSRNLGERCTHDADHVLAVPLYLVGYLPAKKYGGADIQGSGTQLSAAALGKPTEGRSALMEPTAR